MALDFQSLFLTENIFVTLKVIFDMDYSARNSNHKTVQQIRTNPNLQIDGTDRNMAIPASSYISPLLNSHVKCLLHL